MAEEVKIPNTQNLRDYAATARRVLASPKKYDTRTVQLARYVEGLVAACLQMHLDIKMLGKFMFQQAEAADKQADLIALTATNMKKTLALATAGISDEIKRAANANLDATAATCAGLSAPLLTMSKSTGYNPDTDPSRGDAEKPQ